MGGYLGAEEGRGRGAAEGCLHVSYDWAALSGLVHLLVYSKSVHFKSVQESAVASMPFVSLSCYRAEKPFFAQHQHCSGCEKHQS